MSFAQKISLPDANVDSQGKIVPVPEPIVPSFEQENESALKNGDTIILENGYSSSSSSEADSGLSNYVHLNKLTLGATLICLNNTIDKLMIINSILQLNDEEDWYIPFKYDSIERRIMDIKKTQTLLPDSVRDPLFKLTGLQKLKRDSTMIIRTFEIITKELQNNQKVSFLLNNVELFEKYNQDEELLFEECQENITAVRKLINDIRKEAKQSNERLKVLNSQIENLDNVVHDAGLNVDLTLRFTNHWDLNRYNQNKMRLEIEENHIQKDIDEGKTAIENENRVHSEIEKYLRLNQEMNMDMIEKRMAMFDTDTEQSDMDMKKLLADQAIQRKEYKNMKKEYRRRTAEMAEWINDKSIREAIEKTLQKQNDAATRIQAWFRGFMARHAIGPYKFLKGLKRKAAAKKTAQPKASKA